MKRKTVYAIFPYDMYGNVAGVYVGVTEDKIKRRITNHLCCYSAKHGQEELHNLMRMNGFHYVILAHIDYRDRLVEYDWIDFFNTMTDLPVFNDKLTCANADWRRLGGQCIRKENFRMYPNLNAELARHKMTVMMLSEKTGIPYSTLAPKLRGEKPVKMNEAMLIRDTIDDGLTLDYLFRVEGMEVV